MSPNEKSVTMGIPNEAFRMGDVYIDFPYEQVMFRCEAATKRAFRKFYGKTEEDIIPHTNDLFNEARIAGDQITAEAYAKGRPRIPQFALSDDKRSLLFSIDHTTTFNFPVAQTEVVAPIVVVRLDIPPKAHFNENIFGLDADGKILWQIPKRPHPYEDSPYTSLVRDGDTVIATNWDGLQLTLAPATGAVLREFQGR